MKVFSSDVYRLALVLLLGFFLSVDCLSKSIWPCHLIQIRVSLRFVNESLIELLNRLVVDKNSLALLSDQSLQSDVSVNQLNLNVSKQRALTFFWEKTVLEICLVLSQKNVFILSNLEWLFDLAGVFSCKISSVIKQSDDKITCPCYIPSMFCSVFFSLVAFSLTQFFLWRKNPKESKTKRTLTKKKHN